MSHVIDKPRKMFENARAYSKAAYVLNQQAFGPPLNIQYMDLGLPSQVNAALALELYFKTLFFLEKGEDFKVNGRFSHDFYLLFGQLDSSTRQRMESAFAESIKDRDMSDIEKLEKASSVLAPRDLIGNLSVWKDVFVSMRYIHEPSGKRTPMVFFPEIENSVLASILLLRPEWRHSVSFTWQRVS